MSEPWLTIESWTSADGKKRCKVVQREDGFFAYVEDTFVTLDERKFGGGIYAFWKPSHSSGLFESAEAAKAEALGEFKWLSQATPSN